MQKEYFRKQKKFNKTKQKGTLILFKVDESFDSSFDRVHLHYILCNSVGDTKLEP